MPSKLTLKQGEAKTIKFTARDAAGAAVDLSAATLLLGVKKVVTDTSYVFSHLDADFDKTNAANGIVTVDLIDDDTDQEEWVYLGELKCTWDAGTVINKSATFYLNIINAITT